ncbi:MAG: peptide chain release factor N(5)-glutamine methyltransferase [Spiroplasma sp.]
MKIYQFLKFAKILNNNENVNKIILANLLAKDLSWIYANLNSLNLDEKQLKQYLILIKKYVAGFPLGYILGYVFFSGNKILVDQNVLIPRNETEILVEKTLLYSSKLFNLKSLDILDLCTGSGCIAVSLALKRLDWNFIASDISTKALNIAALNKDFYYLNNIKLVESDLFTNLKNSKFDIVVANPPYINQNAINYSTSLVYEPELALFADDFGLYYYQRILASVLKFTKQDFLIALEIGFDQKQALEKLLVDKFNSYFYWFEKDYSNHWRFLFISSKKL